jgi:hypothetical protein
MTTNKTDWANLDAGELREVLAAELAVWQTRGFDTPARAARWHRYARRLAKMARGSLDAVIDALRNDAAGIRARDAAEAVGTKKEITFRAFEFATAHEAIQHANAEGGEAVLIHGRNMVVDTATLDMLYAARTEFAHLCDHEMPDGTHRIITVPVDPHD